MCDATYIHIRKTIISQNKQGYMVGTLALFSKQGYNIDILKYTLKKNYWRKINQNYNLEENSSMQAFNRYHYFPCSGWKNKMAK